MSTQPDLKPCPFCGGPAAVTLDPGNEVWNQRWTCGCKPCGVFFRAFGSNSYNSNRKLDQATELSVRTSWNTRK